MSGSDKDSAFSNEDEESFDDDEEESEELRHKGIKKTLPKARKKERPPGYVVQTRNRDNVSEAQIKETFDLPVRDAAKRLNIGVTKLKILCRKYGIKRWPYRQLRALGAAQSPVSDDPPSPVRAPETKRTPSSSSRTKESSKRSYDSPIGGPFIPAVSSQPLALPVQLSSLNPSYPRAFHQPLPSQIAHTSSQMLSYPPRPSPFVPLQARPQQALPVQMSYSLQMHQLQQMQQVQQMQLMQQHSHGMLQPPQADQELHYLVKRYMMFENQVKQSPSSNFSA